MGLIKQGFEIDPSKSCLNGPLVGTDPFYHPHPKDGDGNSFSLSVKNTQREGVPHLHPIILQWSHVLSQGVPQWLVPGPFLGGVPPRQVRMGWGIPPPRIGQQMGNLIRGGRYVSCLHGGGLSCLNLWLRSCDDIYIHCQIYKRTYFHSWFLLKTGPRTAMLRTSQANCKINSEDQRTWLLPSAEKAWLWCEMLQL